MDNIIRLPLEKAYNVRELGGYAAKDRSIKWKRFLRADDISQLSNADITYLKDYGVTSILDLRSPQECRDQKDAMGENDGVAHYNISFMVGQVDNIMDTMDSSFTLKEFYLQLLQEYDCVKSIMSVIANAPEGCMLFHCAGGKDRTGVLSMLLLSLVGVDKVDIMSNYQVSHTNLRRNKKIMKISTPENMDISCMYSEPENMEECLNYIEEKFTDTQTYLQRCGVKLEDIQKIKRKLLF